jgi:hypothetical protein
VYVYTAAPTGSTGAQLLFGPTPAPVDNQQLTSYLRLTCAARARARRRPSPESSRACPCAQAVKRVRVFTVSYCKQPSQATPSFLMSQPSQHKACHPPFAQGRSQQTAFCTCMYACICTYTNAWPKQKCHLSLGPIRAAHSRLSSSPQACSHLAPWPSCGPVAYQTAPQLQTLGA